jgi:trigger factor
MSIAAQHVNFAFDKVHEYFGKARITIPQPFIAAVYRQAALTQRTQVTIPGFARGQAPLAYVEENYHSSLIHHTTSFLYRYFVLEKLFELLDTQEVLLAGEPRLSEVFVAPDKDGHYVFEISLHSGADLTTWKTLPFRPPRRKNYKDIDRQVESFIKDELNAAKEYTDNGIMIGDWVYFSIYPVDAQGTPLFGQANILYLWIKIGNEEADNPFQEIFLGKRSGEQFSSNAACLQEYFCNQLEGGYTFHIMVHEIVSQAVFSFEQFKQHFKLKNSKEIQQKLIEVFSYRNDLSLRRSILEDGLRLMVQKHSVQAPQHFILRQQQLVLETVSHNPDYQVYKTHPHFKDHIQQLAEKQAREILLIDQLIIQENISANPSDVASYLNLIKRPRTKEFIYFNPPNTKLEGQESPLPAVVMKRCCLREKALNHVLYHLTKK